jgi:hypothetical protein
MSYEIIVNQPAQYVIEYSNQRGPQGPAGSNASATTDASLLVSGTLSDARLSDNVARLSAANVFEDKQSFAGVDHAGLCLQSLTTAQYNTLIAANGDLFRDSTTDRIDARLTRGTVELIDSAGGQTINGALTATTLMVGGSTGPLLRNNAGSIEVRNNANSALANMSASQFTASFFRDSTNQANYFGAGIHARNTWILAYSNDGTDFGTKDLSFSRNAAGVLQIGNGTANASGSLNLTNLTASGTVTSQGIRLLDTAGGTLRGVLNCPSWDTSYVALRNGTLAETAANSAVYQSSQGDTGINAASGRGVSILIANAVVVAVTSGNVAVTGNLTASGTVRLGTYTVGTLPSASANTRAIAYVTDSSVGTFGSIVASGGSLGVTVYSNGTNWLVSGGSVVPQKAITSGTAAPTGGTDGDIYLQYV